MPLCLSWKIVPTSQMHPVWWNHPLIEYDQKRTLLFTKFMREGIQIQIVKLWKSAWQPTSLWKECLKKSIPPPPKFVSFIQQKRYTPSEFFVEIHQLSNARGYPFIKIGFNGTIRTSLTESNKIKQHLLHHPVRAPIFVYYSWVASYMRQPNYVGFSKTGWTKFWWHGKSFNPSADTFC